MKSFFRMKLIAAVLSLGLLLFLSVQTMAAFLPEMKELVQNGEVAAGNIPELINATLDENVYQRYSFINVYGLLQKLMNKNEENNFEVVADTRGFFHYTFFADGPELEDDLVERVARLRDSLRGHAKTIALMPPDKYVRGYTEFPTGIPYPYFNENADLYLLGLREKGVPYLDLRENLLDNGLPPEELFFKTDHHWTVQTAFWAFTELVDYFHKEHGINLDPGHYYTDINNYNRIKYDNFYIGSMGRKTGPLYAGADDFTLIFPKFATDYTCYYDIKSNQFELTGIFEEALLYSYALNTPSDDFSISADRYGAYLHGNPPLVHITNNDNPQGLKVLFIKDSMSVPLAAFFSTVCSDVWLIDPRYYEGDMEQFAGEQELDFVIVSIYPQALVDEFFPYCIKNEE